MLTFEGDGIATVELSGGAGEAMIIEVCVEPMPGPATPVPGTDPFAVGIPPVGAAAVPVVTGVVDGDLADAWIGRTVEVRGRCPSSSTVRGTTGPDRGAGCRSPRRPGSG